MIDINKLKYTDMVEMGRNTTDRQILQQIIDKISYYAFIEQMAEFLDWDAYNKYERDISILEKRLQEVK